MVGSRVLTTCPVTHRPSACCRKTYLCIKFGQTRTYPALFFCVKLNFLKKNFKRVFACLFCIILWLEHICLTPSFFNSNSFLYTFQTYQVDFVIDIHAHSSLHGSFIYGNTYEDVYRYERHLVFPRLFNTNAKDFVPEHMMFNADERKAGSARRFCCDRLSDTVNAYTLQISMGGYYLKDKTTVALYNEEGCKCKQYICGKY